MHVGVHTGPTCKADSRLPLMVHNQDQLLVVQAGAEVNAGTDQKWTCLHLAAKEQNTGVVRVLLENNADGALRDSYGATALHYAVQLADLAHFNALHSSPRCVVKTTDKKGVALH